MDEFKKMLLLKRDSVPSSYSAVDAGLVSSVKNREIAEAVWLSVCILLSSPDLTTVVVSTGINFEYLNMQF